MNGWGRKDAQARKRVFLRHLCIKAMILPRQARDKHRESSKRDAFSYGPEQDCADSIATIANMSARGECCKKSVCF
jgi:hypothetical protein